MNIIKKLLLKWLLGDPEIQLRFRADNAGIYILYIDLIEKKVSSRKVKIN